MKTLSYLCLASAGMLLLSNCETFDDDDDDDDRDRHRGSTVTTTTEETTTSRPLPLNPQSTVVETQTTRSY